MREEAMSIAVAIASESLIRLSCTTTKKSVFLLSYITSLPARRQDAVLATAIKASRGWHTDVHELEYRTRVLDRKSNVARPSKSRQAPRHEQTRPLCLLGDRTSSPLASATPYGVLLFRTVYFS